MDKIVSKTPLRISFVGGGTDRPSFYQKHGGAVISTAIDKYVTVTISPRRNTKICVSSPEGIQTASSVDEIDHPIVCETMHKSRIRDSDSMGTGVSVPRPGGSGINIDIASDVAPGSGLGDSSALTVGLLNALRAYYTEQQAVPRLKEIEIDSHPRFTTNPIYTWTLAREACEIEINRLGQHIGKQDQYIAAYGGFRRFTFESKGNVGMELIKPPDGLERVLMLFDIPMAGHETNKILSAQNQVGSPQTLLKMKRQCRQLYSLLCTGDVTAIGCLLHEAWKLKKSLTPSICSDRLDTIYRLALNAGALGGKGLGAGGGGHFLVLAPLKTQKTIVKALDGLATHVPFKFEPKGSRLV